jgi:hypothetical protein
VKEISEAPGWSYGIKLDRYRLEAVKRIRARRRASSDHAPRKPDALSCRHGRARVFRPQIRRSGMVATSTVDGYSLAAVPVEMYFEMTLLAKATALVWQLGEQYFLITNWHVVSGKNPLTGEHLDKTTLAEPNRIRVVWNAKQAPMKMRLSEEFSLRGPGGEPHWWVHPEHGQRVDVIAFPIVKTPAAELVPINKIPENDLAIHIGMDVFVIGYPYGPDDSYMPVWKRGSIASEPELVGPQNLFLYIDTASRKGMSGSPVIRRSYVHDFA